MSENKVWSLLRLNFGKILRAENEGRGEGQKREEVHVKRQRKNVTTPPSLHSKAAMSQYTTWSCVYF